MTSKVSFLRFLKTVESDKTHTKYQEGKLGLTEPKIAHLDLILNLQMRFIRTGHSVKRIVRSTVYLKSLRKYGLQTSISSMSFTFYKI